MRKLQQSDKFYIEQMRNYIRQSSSQSSLYDTQYSFDENCFDQFHHLFIKYHRLKYLKIKDSLLVKDKHKGQQFTVYQIQVGTDQLVYHVNRRFKEFHQLYKRVKKMMPECLSFPSKNYNPFVSSVSPSIVQQRKQKLDSFLKQVLKQVNQNKDSTLTMKLFNFIELKQTYQNRFTCENTQRKSNSERSSLSKFHHSFRGHSSLKSFHSYSQNSIQLYIILINQPCNPGKHLEQLQQIIKNKKFKMSNQQIKVIFLGFQVYHGLLKFGLTNPFQSNRITALQILVDLLLPQRNLLFQRYAKFLQKVPIQLWTLQDINYLQNPIFKVLYFRLLSIYCQRAQKGQQKGQKYILKTLFMFHSNLTNDYFQWKQINQIQNSSLKRRNSKSMPDYLNHKWIQQKQQIKQKQERQNIQKLEYANSDIQIWFYQNKNILVLKMKCSKSVEEVQQISFQWNRFVQKYQVQEFTDHYLYCLKNQNKTWNIKIKIIKEEHQSFQQIQKNTLIPSQMFNNISPLIQKQFFRIKRQQSLFDFYPDYQEQILLSSNQQEKYLIIAIKVSKDVDIFRGFLRSWAYQLAQDCLNSFT